MAKGAPIAGRRDEAFPWLRKGDDGVGSVVGAFDDKTSVPHS
jgi:hypothetical protein